MIDAQKSVGRRPNLSQSTPENSDESAAPRNRDAVCSPVVAGLSLKYSVYDGKMLSPFIIDPSYPLTYIRQIEVKAIRLTQALLAEQTKKRKVMRPFDLGTYAGSHVPVGTRVKVMLQWSNELLGLWRKLHGPIWALFMYKRPTEKHTTSRPIPAEYHVEACRTTVLRVLPTEARGSERFKELRGGDSSDLHICSCDEHPFYMEFFANTSFAEPSRDGTPPVAISVPGQESTTRTLATPNAWLRRTCEVCGLTFARGYVGARCGMYCAYTPEILSRYASRGHRSQTRDINCCMEAMRRRERLDPRVSLRWHKS